MSISALEHFARSDTHALQYALIAKSLLATALKYLEHKETQERLRRTENSSKLFGLVINPAEGHRPHPGPLAASDENRSGTTDLRTAAALESHASSGPPFTETFADIDATLMPFPDSLSQSLDLSILTGAFDGDDDLSFGTLNLFPLLDGGGHIDLAHHFEA